jgi:hypothetical protein
VPAPGRGAHRLWTRRQLHVEEGGLPSKLLRALGRREDHGLGLVLRNSCALGCVRHPALRTRSTWVPHLPSSLASSGAQSCRHPEAHCGGQTARRSIGATRLTSMFYEDDDLPLLAAEVAKIPPIRDADWGPATTSPAPSDTGTKNLRKAVGRRSRKPAFRSRLWSRGICTRPAHRHLLQ